MPARERGYIRPVVSLLVRFRLFVVSCAVAVGAGAVTRGDSLGDGLLQAAVVVLVVALVGGALLALAARPRRRQTKSRERR
jgi:hypothetical protein